MWVFSTGLILDEPVGSMKLAHIVIKRSCPDQVDIGADRPRTLLGQAADHQGVLKGAWGF